MEAYNLRFEDAEMLKITCGSLPPDQLNENEVITISSDEEIPELEVPVRGVLEIIELRIREIAAIVMSELVKSGFAEKLSQGIILTGGTANLYVVKEIFSETSNLHTRIGKPLKHIKRNPFSRLENPKYSTVIGLLLASYYPFDVRVPASVLHSDYLSPQGKQKLNQAKPPKGGGMNGFINKIKDFMNSGNEIGGDTYDRGR
jgi:cell division protein FtsA